MLGTVSSASFRTFVVREKTWKILCRGFLRNVPFYFASAREIPDTVFHIMLSREFAARGKVEPGFIRHIRGKYGHYAF